MAGDGVKTPRARDRAKAAVKEPSTWAALGALASIFIGIDPSAIAAAAQVAAGAAGAVSDPSITSGIKVAAVLGSLSAILGIVLPERKQ